MLFVGSFRHIPNLEAIEWFVERVLPLILERKPDARLVVAGSDPPPRGLFAKATRAVELLGFVEDIRTELACREVFVCPILSGSGVRVKLLEAFASGIPVVSTYIGAEGLARKDGEFCFLADDPAAFADRVMRLFANPEKGLELAAAAREEVMANWDMRAITAKLVASYRRALEKNGAPTRDHSLESVAPGAD